MTKLAAILIYGKKNLQKSLSPEPAGRSPRNWFFVVCFCFLHRGLLSIIVCSNDDHEVTLTYVTAKSNFVTGFSIAKGENNGYFKNCCSQWPEN